MLLANSAMGLKGLGEFVFLLFGILCLLASMGLGAAAWVTALRPPKSVGWIFGRGFLGVAAVFAFAIGACSIGIGLQLWFRKTPAWVLSVVGILFLAFMATEFFIAGTLYRKANKTQPSTIAKLLSIVSYAVGGLFTLATCVVMLALLISFVSPPKPRPSANVRRYTKGCEANDGGDCNMLGLRYKSGATNLPKNPAKAAELFKKSCELGTAIGCRNLAGLYRNGEGVPKDEALEKQYDERYTELSGLD